MSDQKVLIAGIDPGKNGGAIILDNFGNIIAKSPMFMIDKSEFDSTAYSYFLKNDQYQVDHVVVERVTAMPKNGVVSMFHFGMAFMFCQVVPKMLSIPMTLVTPQAWQKVMHMGIDKTLDPKQRSLIAFSRLYPDTDLRMTSRCKNQHDGLVDALLLAEWGRRTLKLDTYK